MVGDVIVGLVANTKEPEPVSSLITPANSDEVVAASADSLSVVTTRVLLVGMVVPLTLVAVATPRDGVVRLGLVANTSEPLPVSSVTAEARLAELGVAKNVATPDPRPLIPVETGNPVALVSVPVITPAPVTEKVVDPAPF
jgi:hypothetical protein